MSRGIPHALIAAQPIWERRALETGYFPDTLAASHDLIQLLRARLQAFLDTPLDTRATGMAPADFAVYHCIRRKAGALISREAIRAALNLHGCTPNLITVHIHNVRKKLPKGEKIITVHRVGYFWQGPHEAPEAPRTEQPPLTAEPFIRPLTKFELMAGRACPRRGGQDLGTSQPGS